LLTTNIIGDSSTRGRHLWDVGNCGQQFPGAKRICALLPAGLYRPVLDDTNNGIIRTTLYSLFHQVWVQSAYALCSLDSETGPAAEPERLAYGSNRTLVGMRCNIAPLQVTVREPESPS
jgi:hypothetical protein